MTIYTDPSTPIYDAVAEELGWSLADLGEPFDPVGCRLDAEALYLGRQLLGRSLHAHLDRQIDAAVDRIIEKQTEAEA